MTLRILGAIVQAGYCHPDRCNPIRSFVGTSHTN